MTPLPRFATTPNRNKPRKLKKHHHWAWGGPLHGWELYFPPTERGLPAGLSAPRWTSYYELVAPDDETPFYEWRGEAA